jgi:putative ABC transport system ATP-binding protein
MAEKKSSEKKEKHTHLIRLRNVAKYYQMGEEIVRAVDGINIEVRPGEFVAIMGPSGSGKSTTMNLVGSLDLATQGDIFLDGLDIEELHESDLAQVRGRVIGFIFQSFNLIQTLTAKENVMLPMMFQDIDSEVREARAEQLLKMVGLEERMDHHPNQLSGGEQQRVAIARSLANNPEIILADEPTGNLDTKTGEIVLHYLDKLNKEGKTIIMVTHDPRLAEEHAQVIFHIKDGKLEKVTKKIKGRWVVIDRGTHN